MYAEYSCKTPASKNKVFYIYFLYLFIYIFFFYKCRCHICVCVLSVWVVHPDSFFGERRWWHFECTLYRLYLCRGRVFFFPKKKIWQVHQPEMANKKYHQPPSPFPLPPPPKRSLRKRRIRFVFFSLMYEGAITVFWINWFFISVLFEWFFF